MIPTDEENEFSNALVEALLSAYPSKESLTLMVHREIPTTLNQIIQNAESYEYTVYKLVEWAIAQGRVQELIIGACKQNPGNPKLRKFVDEKLLEILPEEVDPSLCSQVKLLVPILKKFSNFSNIIDCLRETEEGIIDNRSKDIDILRNSEIASQVKWLVTLNLLLSVYVKRSDDRFYLIDFVRNLKYREEVDSSIRNKLNDWLQSLPESIQPKPQKTSAKPSGKLESQDIQKLYGYFLIVVDYPEETASKSGEDRKLPVKGYLLTRVGGKGSYSDLEEVYLELKTDTGKLQDKSQDKGDGRSDRPGLCCSFLQIKENVDHWAEQTLKVLITKCLKLRESNIPNLSPSPVLMLEVFLPFDHLLEPVDEWPVSKGPYSPESLGKKRIVAVRCSDRVSYESPYVALIETWEWAKPLLGQEDRIREKIKPLKSWDDFVPKDFSRRLLGLTLSRSLNVSNNTTRCEKLFGTVIQMGIPIVIGMRQKLVIEPQENAQTTTESPESQDSLEGFLTSECLRNLDYMMDKVLNARKSVSHDHISVWCDEPDRLVALKARRLSA